MADWLKASESFTCGLPGGAQASFFAGRNYRSDAPGVEGREHLFVPLDEDEPGQGTAQASASTPSRRVIPARNTAK